ncbi:TetR/AcrR family transcriptional regulator [Lysinibacillus cavernae]|uniref:TetR/AcrR family transcriptional regulator n=1 Tax=Lysinibacillus cavernae TaxID=2666135 RepID=UPI0012D8B77E|nr:TetR/AcrR family transcriptional regulator [Lysinibacillus cavernae]
MKENYTDLRVIRTVESIKEALLDLIEEKGFESITVKDITTKAKINRGTFYAHYQDKFDLMNSYQEEIMLEISTIAKENIQKLIDDLNTNHTNNPKVEIAVLIFTLLDQNRRFMKAVLGTNGDLSFQTKLKNFMWRTLFESTETPLKQENLLVPREYLASYIASAHIGVVQQWLLCDGKETPQEMARILSTITLNGPFFAAGLKK